MLSTVPVSGWKAVLLRRWLNSGRVCNPAPSWLQRPLALTKPLFVSKWHWRVAKNKALLHPGKLFGCLRMWTPKDRWLSFNLMARRWFLVVVQVIRADPKTPTLTPLKFQEPCGAALVSMLGARYKPTHPQHWIAWKTLGTSLLFQRFQRVNLNLCHANYTKRSAYKDVVFIHVSHPSTFSCHKLPPVSRCFSANITALARVNTTCPGSMDARMSNWVNGQASSAWQTENNEFGNLKNIFTSSTREQTFLGILMFLGLIYIYI